MQKRLKIDKDFVPCQSSDGDEIFRNGIFHFNISELIHQLNSGALNVTLSEMNVSDIPSAFTRINEEHIDSVDLKKPVILAEIAPSRYNLIDGNHRVENAKRTGIKRLPCYKLSVDQHHAFLIDQRGYESYIEYWNSKL